MNVPFICALLYLYMCYFTTRRSPRPVPEGMTADVFVPTINESVDILRRTLMAALRMDHVGEVWLLDDGNRQEMRSLAKQLGCRYITRTTNTHANSYFYANPNFPLTARLHVYHSLLHPNTPTTNESRTKELQESQD